MDAALLRPHLNFSQHAMSRQQRDIGVDRRAQEAQPAGPIRMGREKRIAEVDASFVMVQADIAAAIGQVQQARGAYDQAVEERNTKLELQARNADVVARREIERLQNIVEGREGGVNAALAAQKAAETKLRVLLPAERASAEAARNQAQVDLDKTTIYAGVDGRVEQFTLRVGDFVNPLMRPAGVLSRVHAAACGSEERRASRLRQSC